LAQEYDLVLQGGRVIDPETNLDGVRNIAVSAGKIARISSESLPARQTIDATGLVVAPGFIDLHQHGQNLESQKLKALDGVTTALEMEIGAADVTQFLKSKQGHSIINYGTTASHAGARALAFGTSIPSGGILPLAGPATNQPASTEQISKIEQRLNSELDAGALGVGMGIQYTPGATPSEIIAMFRLAAERNVPVFTHMRGTSHPEPGIWSVSEVIAAAAISGASLHIVHINSSCVKQAPACLAMIAGARARGLDITTEAYPYEAGMTEINSALFNPGWREEMGVDYPDLMLPETGERLTKARFEELHNSTKPTLVVMFNNSMAVVDEVIPNPLVMIASDGAEGHPRCAGTYSRVLARYVREQGRLTLTQAIRKMSLMPAQRLEKSTSEAHRKGRLQEGADADMVLFNPQTVADKATYQDPLEPSIGMRYVLVGGTLVVDKGKLVPDVYPGRALTGPGRSQH
jgi:N-acyl-D-aspartate/D-glutamate deacylase